MAYWCDDRTLTIEQQRLDAAQDDARRKMKAEKTMTEFRVTIERKIVRTVLVNAVTNAAARAQVESYGVIEAFSDYHEIGDVGSDTCRIIRVALRPRSIG